MEALPEILCWTGFVERKRLGWLRGGRVAEVARRSVGRCAGHGV